MTLTIGALQPIDTLEISPTIASGRGKGRSMNMGILFLAKREFLDLDLNRKRGIFDSTQNYSDKNQKTYERRTIFENQNTGERLQPYFFERCCRTSE